MVNLMIHRKGGKEAGRKEPAVPGVWLDPFLPKVSTSPLLTEPAPFTLTENKVRAVNRFAGPQAPLLHRQFSRASCVTTQRASAAFHAQSQDLWSAFQAAHQGWMKLDALVDFMFSCMETNNKRHEEGDFKQLEVVWTPASRTVGTVGSWGAWSCDEGPLRMGGTEDTTLRTRKSQWCFKKVWERTFLVEGTARAKVLRWQRAWRAWGPREASAAGAKWVPETVGEGGRGGYYTTLSARGRLWGLNLRAVGDYWRVCLRSTRSD